MIYHGDCIEVMAGMEPESVDAIVTDPPYGLEFMGKSWDRLDTVGKTSHGGFVPGMKLTGSGNPTDRLPSASYSGSSNVKCRTCGKWQWDHVGRKCECERPDFPSVKAHQGRLMQAWHQQWAEAAYRVAKPSAYLLAFGGTRTVHRMTVALEDAGWIIRDMLVWAYASGFPKSKASLKPAWEPIVMARKPGPLRMLAIDECRTDDGRWPANVLLTDAIFDGDRPVHRLDCRCPCHDAVTAAYEREPDGSTPYGCRRCTDEASWEGVVGGGDTHWQRPTEPSTMKTSHWGGGVPTTRQNHYDTEPGTYSRFFLIPKADRADREPVLGGPTRTVDARMGLTRGGPGEPGKGSKEGYEYRPAVRANHHPTVKPTELMRHLVRLVTPTGGIVLDPFLGSGTTAIAAELEGFSWIGIEKEAEYVAIAEARLNGTQRGLGLDVPAPTPRVPKTHPDLSKHQPKRRAPGENWSGRWGGTDEEPAA